MCYDFRKHSIQNSDNVNALGICHTEFIIVHAYVCVHMTIVGLEY